MQAVRTLEILSFEPGLKNWDDMASSVIALDARTEGFAEQSSSAVLAHEAGGQEFPMLRSISVQYTKRPSGDASNHGCKASNAQGKNVHRQFSPNF